jgi:hypothetical protein
MLLKKKVKLGQLFLLCILFGISACNSSNGTLKNLGLVDPPIPELAKAYTLFEIDPSEENVLEIPSGTKITIQANSLVDEAGDLVSGEVTIKYREYHDAVDVLLSGIPMDFQSQGQKRSMQTAGMFDLAAAQKEQAVFIKEGAGVQVDFASFEAGTDYNFFALDQEEGWAFVDYVAPMPNENRVALEKEVNSLSRKLKSKKKKLFVFNYDAILDVKYNNISSEVNKNRNNKSLKRKTQKYGLESYDSRVYQAVKYKGNFYPADMMVWKNKGKYWPSWARTKKCDITLKAIKGNTYEATVKKKDSETVFVGKIELVVPLKYIFKYSPEQWANDSKNIFQKISKSEEKIRLELEEKRKKMEQQAAVIRSFEIAGFGIYNYDKLLKEPNRIDIIAEFELEGSEDLEWVICLPEDGKTVIKYPKAHWELVTLLPNQSAQFVTILSDKSVGIYSAEEYAAIKFDELKTVNNQRPQVKFELVKKTEVLESEDQLRDLIATIGA